MRRPQWIFALVVLGTILGACITPSIPIPPPDPARMQFDFVAGTDTVTFAYPATENYVGSIVYVYNRTLGKGVIENTRPDGSVGPTDPLQAVVGHEVIVTFENDDQTVSTCIVLREGTQSSTTYCSP
ncbi:MAG: hypothetical protein KF773_28365 [Deltaproteobacteria bacterium]|nr:hypothetical protein [Deltaproteobacteria bacterium]MCW5804484.1 hypothetical protein [Deltaproteobacteria bacterium]